MERVKQVQTKLGFDDARQTLGSIRVRQGSDLVGDGRRVLYINDLWRCVANPLKTPEPESTDPRPEIRQASKQASKQASFTTNASQLGPSNARHHADDQVESRPQGQVPNHPAHSTE